ncbi:MAG TPA: cell envelope integrity protein TolA [Candidatus Babeliales bacterium]|nr:cell envelope integrity protein TolA [Candidatus Babeliales bacterium]
MKKVLLLFIFLCSSNLLSVGGLGIWTSPSQFGNQGCNPWNSWEFEQEKSDLSSPRSSGQDWGPWNSRLLLSPASEEKENLFSSSNLPVKHLRSDLPLCDIFPPKGLEKKKVCFLVGDDGVSSIDIQKEDAQSYKERLKDLFSKRVDFTSLRYPKPTSRRVRAFDNRVYGDCTLGQLLGKTKVVIEERSSRTRISRRIQRCDARDEVRLYNKWWDSLKEEQDAELKNLRKEEKRLLKEAQKIEAERKAKELADERALIEKAQQVEAEQILEELLPEMVGEESPKIVEDAIKEEREAEKRRVANRKKKDRKLASAQRKKAEQEIRDEEKAFLRSNASDRVVLADELSDTNKLKRYIAYHDASLIELDTAISNREEKVPTYTLFINDTGSLACSTSLGKEIRINQSKSGQLWLTDVRGEKCHLQRRAFTSEYSFVNNAGTVEYLVGFTDSTIECFTDCSEFSVKSARKQEVPTPRNGLWLHPECLEEVNGQNISSVPYIISTRNLEAGNLDICDLDGNWFELNSDGYYLLKVIQNGVQKVIKFKLKKFTLDEKSQISYALQQVSTSEITILGLHPDLIPHLNDQMFSWLSQDHLEYLRGCITAEKALITYSFSTIPEGNSKSVV